MYLEQFYYLLAIKETKSLANASKMLFITEQALSKSIKNLEKELNCQLLIRNNKGVSFTPEGVFLLQQSQKITDIMQEIQSHFKPQFSTEQIEHIRIQAEPFIAERTFSNLVLHYCQNLPQISLDISTGNVTTIISNLLEDKVDIGIISQLKINDSLQPNSFPNNLFYTEVISMPLYVSLSTLSPLAKYDELSLAELTNYPMISLNSLLEINESFMQPFKKYKNFRIIFAPNSSTFRKLVISNFGWALSPYNQIAQELEKSASLTLKSTNPKITSSFGILVHNNSLNQEKLIQFISLYKEFNYNISF